MKKRPFFQIEDFPQGKWTDGREIKFPPLPPKNNKESIQSLEQEPPERWWDK